MCQILCTQLLTKGYVSLRYKVLDILCEDKFLHNTGSEQDGFQVEGGS